MLEHDQGPARYLGAAAADLDSGCDVYECASGWWLIGPGRRITKAPAGPEVIDFARNLLVALSNERCRDFVNEVLAAEGAPATAADVQEFSTSLSFPEPLAAR